MNGRDLKYFKKRLNEWLEALMEQSTSTLDGMRKNSERLTEVTDQAAVEYDSYLTFRIRTREKILMRKIQQSLRDIEEGCYGICELCEDQIAIERLKARMVARHCIRCKTEMERQERLAGK